MKFHDDMGEAFRPLFGHLADVYNTEEDIKRTVGQYMYMCHDDERTYYKHFGSRRYFNIFQDGSVEGNLEDWRTWKP